MSGERRFRTGRGGDLSYLGCSGGTDTDALGPPGCAGAPGLDYPEAVAVSPHGQNVYAAAYESNTVEAFRRLADGNLSWLGCLGNPAAGVVPAPGCAGAAGVNGTTGVAVSPDGQNVYADGSSSNAVMAFNRVTSSPGGGGSAGGGGSGGSGSGGGSNGSGGSGSGSDGGSNGSGGRGGGASPTPG